MRFRHKRTRTLIPVKARIVSAAMLGAMALTAAPIAHSLAAPAPTHALINVGTKDFGEENLVSDMYALLLRRAGFNVPNPHVLATTALLQPALLHGSIDMYPEYTGTGLQVLGINRVITSPIKTYDLVKSQYQRRFHLTWLDEAPMNDTNGVGITQATASKYHLHNLSQLAKVAGQLTFAGLPECASRPDCLAGMQKKYGIKFKSVASVNSAPIRYSGLLHGTYDAVEVFTTDGPIRANHLVVLADNKHAVFPADHIAPIVRDSILNKYPKIRNVLNRMAPYLTTVAIKKMNVQVVLNSADPMKVARAFLKSKHLL